MKADGTISQWRYFFLYGTLFATIRMDLIEFQLQRKSELKVSEMRQRQLEKPDSAIAKAAFRRKFYTIRSDIASGIITFYNTPVWTEKLLNVTALNYTLVKLTEEARDN